MTQPKKPSDNTIELPREDHKATKKQTSSGTNSGTKLNTRSMSSAPADQVSKPAHKSTVHSSEYGKVSAIQNGNSRILPKHLNIMSICAYYNKLFTVCNTKNIPGNLTKEVKEICLHVFDLTSGFLEKIIPLWDLDDVTFVDMCMAKIEHWECLALGYAPTARSVHWFIRFMNFEGGPYYTFALEISSVGSFCAFDNKLLRYHPEFQTILVYDTSKWPIESNEQYFDTGLDESIMVLNLITCLGKKPNQRLVILDYLHENRRGTLCLDLYGKKLWKINEPYVMRYPCGDNRGHVFLLDHTSQTIFVRKDKLSTEVLLKIPAGIKKYVWSDTMNKMVVLHYNEVDSLAVSCYDIIEQ